MALPIRPEIIPILSKYNASLSDLPSSPNELQSTASSWIVHFGDALSSGSVDSVLALLIPDQPIWRDLFALSWDFRTRIGTDAVQAFLVENLANSGISVFTLSGTAPSLQKVNGEVGWINVFASFESAIGYGTAVIHLVPTRLKAGSGVIWKAQGILMDLDELKGYPPLVGRYRKQEPVLGGWEEGLAKEKEFTSEDPTVVIIGGSQSGLVVAARLRALGISSVVLERHSRLGESWRQRYDALCLHDPVWCNHMPYLPFPSTWPAYCPAKKLANWIESYASILELPVWLSTNATKVYRSDTTNLWYIDVERESEKRTLKARHVVFAIGWGAGSPSTPEYPGTDEFTGEILHTSAHKKAMDFIGKRVAVIGSSTSSHDVCADFASHGVDVTMVQRSPTYVMSNASWRRVLALYAEDGPPIDIADRLFASFSAHLSLALSLGDVKANKERDKEMLEGLRKRGFHTYDGPQGTGYMGLLWQRGGGFYFDTGACDLIIDGSIKVKSNARIERFTKDGLLFTDGTTLNADVIMWATGYEVATKGIKRLLDPKEADALKPMWQLDDEGELGGLWRHSGLKGVYVTMGNLQLGRIYSKHLALRIKAIEEGILEV